MKRFNLGKLQIAIINTGDLRLSLKEVENISESEMKKYPEVFGSPLQFPSHSILIASDDQKILVDPGNYDLLRSYDDEFASMVPQSYNPPPSLETQLKALNVSPENIGYVILTHAHYDHYSGVTAKKDGGYFPSFPNARYLLGKADWEDDRLVRKALGNRDSPEAKSLGVIKETGLLELVSGFRALSDNVGIIPSPGESPGHQIVSVRDRGESLYCVGDLFHHSSEIENLAWMANWCDVETNVVSRRKLIELAISENALVVAGHMPPGRLVSKGSKVEFTPEA